MTTELSFPAQEGSTYIIEVDFELTGSNNNTVPVIPTTVFWSLLDKEGNIINNRIQEPVNPAGSIAIILSGNDLALTGNYPAERCVLIEGTYDSSFGSDHTYVEEIYFKIENLVGKT